MSEGYPCSTAERQLTAEARTSGVPALGALLPVHNNKARRQGTARGSRHRDKGRLCRAEPSRAGRGGCRPMARGGGRQAGQQVERLRLRACGCGQLRAAPG